MLNYFPIPCAIVDIETTGGNVTLDRITEIGIIEVTEEGVSEWSTLINPRAPIPAGIQRLTGITDAMVSNAPYFEQVAKEILLRLQGKLFIAHNVRFDYGFIRNEFARLAYTFRSKLLCTVKLSRFLYPDQDGHSLEKIIVRHHIDVGRRHRALDDAKAAYAFMAIAEVEKGEAAVNAALKHQYRKDSLPVHLDATLIEELPHSPGVYYFWGENHELLYIGKSVNIRKRVLSHFTTDHRSSKEMKICQQTRSITFDKTAGELSALILESRQVKALQPIYNRKLRRVSRFYSIHLADQGGGLLIPKIGPVSAVSQSESPLYGLFQSTKKAKEAIQSVCDEHGLCYQVCGIEPFSQRGCSSHQLKRCKGYCVGRQMALQHNVNLLEGLSRLALKVWPYSGAIALVECGACDQEEYLLVNNWCILGTATSMCEARQILESPGHAQIDKDIYRYLVASIFAKRQSVKIIPISPYFSGK